MASQAKKSSKGAQWLYVYVQEEHQVDKSVLHDAYAFTGDYREEGVYQNKKFFKRKDSKRPPVCIYWSSYVGGFEGGWYISNTLGGSSYAWAMVEQDLPPLTGWQKRGGGIYGYHVDVPLKVKTQWVVMQKVHVCEHCMFAPCRAMSSTAHCLEGACIAGMQGSTRDVHQLEMFPRCSDCMEGMLNDLSCSVPLGHAFEHLVDAWYRAFFKDGFCHTASYQRSITGFEKEHLKAQKERKRNKLKARYGGYTSRFAQELACNEPFAKALSDWLWISHSRASAHMDRVRNHHAVRGAHDECACHIPLHVAAGHVHDHTHKKASRRMQRNESKGGFVAKMENACLGGFLALLFCGTYEKHGNHHHQKHEVESREIELTTEPEIAGEPQEKPQEIKARELPVVLTPAKQEGVTRETTYLPYPSCVGVSNKKIEESKRAKQAQDAIESKLVGELEAERLKTAKLETDIAQIQKAEVEREKAYVHSLEELESIIKRKADEHKLLQLQLLGLQQTEQQLRDELALSVSAVPDERLGQLEAEIALERQEKETNRQKLREMEFANAQHAQHRQQLEDELAKLHELHQQGSDQEKHLKEAELIYANKMKEIEANHSSQIQALVVEASQAQTDRQNLKLHFEEINQQHDEEKNQLRNQCRFELLQAEQVAEQIRAQLEAECKSLAAQLDASSQQERDQLQFEQISRQHEQEKAQLRQQFTFELTQADQIRANLEAECNKLASELDASSNQAPGQLHLEQISQQHEKEKAQLRQQLQFELNQAEQTRAELEAECKSLASQLDASSQQVPRDLQVSHEQEKAQLKQQYEFELNQAEQTRAKLEADCKRFASQLDHHQQQAPGQLQLKQISQQHEQEKAQLRQQMLLELKQAEQSRAELDAECKKLASQLDASSQQAGFEEARQALEARHAEEVQQLQLAVAAGNHRSATLEQQILSMEQMTPQEDQAREQELEEARIVIQDLQALQASQEEQMRQMSQAIEESNFTIQELRTDIASKEEGMREVEDENEAERQKVAARIADLEGALIAATEDANVLRGQLEVANAGRAEQMEALQQPWSPERDYMDSQEPSIVIESVSTTVEHPRYLPGQQFADGSDLGDSYRMVPQGQAAQVSYGQTPYEQATYAQPTVLVQEQATYAQPTVLVQSEPRLAGWEPHLYNSEPVVPQTAPIQVSPIQVTRTSSLSGVTSQPSAGTSVAVSSARVLNATKVAYEPVTSARPLTRISAAQVVSSGTGASKYVGSVPSQPRWR